MLTPLAVDPAHPFPYISGLSLNLAVLVRDPDSGIAHFARVKVPNNVPRFVPVGPVDRPTADVPAARGPHRRAPAAAVPRAARSSTTTCSGSPATPTSRSRRTATRTCCRRWSASWPGAGSVPPCGSRSPRRWTRRSSRSCCPEIEVQPRRRRCRCPGCSTSPRSGALRPGPARAQGRAVRAGHPPAAVRGRDARRASSPRCARATCWCTTRTTRSPPACSASSSRRPPTRTCWRSSRRSTAPPVTPRSSTR